MLTKVLVTLGFVAVASAHGENLCIRDGVAMMSSGHSYVWCVRVPQSSVMNSWGGGRSPRCNGGTWELYWKVTGDNYDYARVCWGPLGSCTKYVAQRNERFEIKSGSEKCWSASIPV